MIVPGAFMLLQITDVNSSTPVAFFDMPYIADYDNMKVKASDDYACVSYGNHVSVYQANITISNFLCTLDFDREVYDI